MRIDPNHSCLLLSVSLLAGWGCTAHRPAEQGAAGPAAPAPRLSIEPEEVTVRQGDRQPFHLDIEGLADRRVAWSVRDSRGRPNPGGGTVDAEGVYSPGPSTGKWYYVHATSVADPTLAAVARVEVLPPIVVTEWRTHRMDGWTLRSAAGQEKDAERIAALVERSLAALRQAFAGRGVDPVPSQIRLTVYVHPRPGPEAGIGQMRIHTSPGQADVHLLAPSAHGSPAGDGWVPGYDELYFFKNLVHELSTVFLEELAKGKGDGWTFHQAPSWFVQGIEEYLGCTLAGDQERLERYVRSATREPARVSLVLQVRDVYGDGCALLAFLHETYGAKKVLDLLESPAPDFSTAVHQVLGIDPLELHRLWRSWIEGRACD